MATEHKDNSPNQSDSDDWTLISPPHSSSSSPEREELSPVNDSNESNESSSNSSLEHIGEDGMTEIDLKGVSKPAQRRVKPKIAIVAPSESDGRSSSAEHAELGFQPLDTTTDDDEDETSAKDSRRSSLTQSELGEYVDLGKKDKNDTIQVISNSSGSDVDTEQSSLGVEQSSIVATNDRQAARLLSLKSKLDELSEAAKSSQRDKKTLPLSQLCRRSTTSNVWRVPYMKLWILLYLFILTLLIILNYMLIVSRHDYNHHHNLDKLHSEKSTNSRLPKFLENLMEDFRKIIPTSQQYVELELLHSELNQCIKRQSPTSYKYYISEDRFKEHSTASKHTTKNHKPYRGLVCYGQEAQWRKRFEKLKSKYNLDLRELMQEARKRVTNELLEFYHPSLQFKLILNQIEYLDFIENKRNKKQSEDLVKYLKAENLQLLRRLNQPNETGYQKLIVNLELENSRLKRENEALKENLGQKAGPTYIKQSLELEQYERENIVLKQFHYQVSQDISKSLKQFNLHTIDASTILDDQESLNSQLMLTRGYLRRLREKVSTILIENEGLKEELKEVYLSSTTNKANLPATNNGAYNTRHNNNYNALTTDNCTRALKEVKERNDRLESELERLRQNCSAGKFNGGLEKSSDRQLNRTSDAIFHDRQANLEWKQLSAPETAVDRHAMDSLSLRHNEDIIDELMVFLTKFNNQIESNELTIFDREQQDPPEKAGYLSNEDLNGATKIIPNYIREAVRNERGSMNKCNKIDMTTELRDSQNNAQVKLPPTPPPIHTSNSKHGANISTSSPIVEQHLESSSNSQLSETVQSARVVGDNYIYPTKAQAARDTWFFKRAKQRKQLRGHKVNNNSQIDWVMKRATLREKLRKATSYIDDRYMESDNLKCKKQSSNHRYDCKSKHGKNTDGYKHKKKYNHHKQSNDNRKYYRDEL